MNRTILYYPTIDIPRSSWLRHALLYWDEVSSIVPDSLNENILDELSPDLRYLLAEGQFRPIKPEDLILRRNNWETFNQFQEEFREIISSAEFKNFVRYQHKNLYRVHINKVQSKKTARIHRNKTSEGIFYFLEDEGLASRNPSNPDWLIFEKHTALLYMSLLAKYLADIDSEQTIIGTDYSTYEKFNFKRVAKGEGFPVISFSLNNVLPTPRANVPLERILDFKRKRSDNLLHFKRMMSDFQTKVAKSKSATELKEVSVTFQETLKSGVTDLDAVLKDSRIESILKTFKSLISLKSPTLIASAGAAVNEKLDVIDLPLTMEVVGLVTIGTLELAYNFIEARNKARVKLRESPFSYVYQAQGYGLINRYR